MKRFLFLFLTLMCINVVLGQQKPIIAVYVVADEADSKDMKAMKKVLEAKLVNAFDGSNLFTATERSEAFLAQINKEIAYQQTGRVRDDQLTVLAKNSGAKYLCIADIVELFDEKFVEARLIEAESNNLSGSATSSGYIYSLSSLVDISAEVANKLIKNTPQGKAEQLKKDEQQRKANQAQEEEDAKKKEEALKIKKAQEEEDARKVELTKKAEQDRKDEEAKKRQQEFENKPFRELIYSLIRPTASDCSRDFRFKGEKQGGLGAFHWWRSGDIFFGRTKTYTCPTPSGHGIYIAGIDKNISSCPDAKYFVGRYVSPDGKISGKCYDASGKLIFMGDFRNNNPIGKYPSHNLDEKMKFEIITQDNSKYIGETYGGVKHGYGIVIKNGDIWYGEWRNGERTSNGIWIYDYGSIKLGM